MLQQSKTPVKQQQRKIGAIKDASGKLTPNNVKPEQSKVGQMVQPIEKRNTMKPVKRLSLGATSIEFAKNKRLSLEMKKKSSTNVINNIGWKPMDRRRQSLDSKTKLVREKKPAKLSDQTLKHAKKQSEITDTFRLRNSKVSKTTNK